MTLMFTWLGRVAPRCMAVALALALVSWGLPLFISSSPLRDRMVSASLIGVGFEVEAEAASFGWFAPTSMKGLKVVSNDAQVDVRAEELRISQAWWQLVLFPDQLGHVKVTKPSLTLLLDSDKPGQLSLGKISPVTANLEDAEFNLQLGGMDEPVVSIGGMKVDLRVTDEGVSCLDVEPGRVFDRRPLTAEMCNSLLGLLDPVLGDVVRVEGSLSLDVEHLRVPLDVTPEEQVRQVEFEGVLHLHKVTLGAKTPLLQRMLRVTSDLYGKQAADDTHVVEDNQIDLQVRNGRVHYDHLVLCLPEISPDLKIHSSGSVGLDGSVDLRVTVPEMFVSQDFESIDPMAIVQFHVAGTLDEPRIERMPGDAANALEGSP